MKRTLHGTIMKMIRLTSSSAPSTRTSTTSGSKCSIAMGEELTDSFF